MTILVINSGSSSIKLALFAEPLLQRQLDIRIDNIGTLNAELRLKNNTYSISAADHNQALVLIFDRLANYCSDSGHSLTDITAVGHRVVHGGEQLVDPTVINDDIENTIESVNHLAPLHNSVSLEAIRAARKLLQHCPHVAIFDTGFHASLPAHAKYYALSEALTSSNNHLHRFGFHGISHQYVSQAVAKSLDIPIEKLRIISCHLGNGCSMAAVENGRSVETSMGMTPMEGLVMGTRAGDLDPGLILQLLRDKKHSIDEVDTLLNHSSGLLGLTGSSDMREIEQRAANGDKRCLQAIQIFTHRARKYIGAYAAAMGGVDAIAFTGGIGENSALIRQHIAQRFDFLGAALNEDLNNDAIVTTKSAIAEISNASSVVKLFVIAADEEVAIADSVNQKLKANESEGLKKVKIHVLRTWI